MFDGSACGAGNSAAAGQDAAVELGSSVNVRFPCRRALWLCPLRYTSTKLSERPQVKRLFDILQSGDTLVVRWIDRLGRDYRDVSDTIRHFMREGVVIKTVINAMVFDGATTDPIQQAVRDALIAFMAAMAQAPRRQSPRRRLSRGRKPSFNRKLLDDVNRMLTTGTGASAISKATGLTRQAVLRIKANPVAAERALKVWGM
jgi:putative DNA-invertase from lambdoid prophage Rac